MLIFIPGSFWLTHIKWNININLHLQLQVNKGHSIICNATTSDQASILIEVVCKKMNIEVRSHHFLRLDNGKIIHGKDNLGEALE